MGVVLLWGLSVSVGHMFIQDLSQKSFMDPVNAIHVLKKYVPHERVPERVPQ